MLHISVKALLLPLERYAIVRPCVRPSVCPSVRRVDQKSGRS